MPITDDALRDEVRQFIARVKSRGGEPKDVVKAALTMIVHVCWTYAATDPRQELRQCAENLRRQADGAPAFKTVYEDEIDEIRTFDLGPKK